MKKRKEEIMEQSERRIYLIRTLLEEKPEYQNTVIPEDSFGQKRLLRGLMNVRMPQNTGPEFLAIQDAYLKTSLEEKGITDVNSLVPIQNINTDFQGQQARLYLWQGDITTLRCDAIVNAANAQMLGCFCPCHGCIDNAIHTYSGVQLRAECARIMERQGHEEKTGTAKLTHAYNLPCEYILHTVGPVVQGRVTKRDRELLASCYRSCLQLAEEKKLESVAFCCISTGVFHFPNDQAAEIAVQTVKEFLQKAASIRKVVFNVFKDEDNDIYRRILTN